MNRITVINVTIVLLGLFALMGCSSVQKAPPEQFSFTTESIPTNTDTPEAVWKAMTSRLKAGDTEAASSYFSTASREEFREMFRSIPKNDLPSVLQDMETIKRSSLGEDRAEYYFESKIDGKVITFPVDFVKEAGQWKIVEF